MDEIVIRMAKPEETGILAEIERICFPPQEAASPKQVEERMRTFPENFVVAEADGSPVGFINGGTTDKPFFPMKCTMMSISIFLMEIIRRFSD